MWEVLLPPPLSDVKCRSGTVGSTATLLENGHIHTSCQGTIADSVVAYESIPWSLRVLKTPRTLLQVLPQGVPAATQVR